jgi:hypothetical protein
LGEIVGTVPVGASADRTRELAGIFHRLTGTNLVLPRYRR